MTGSGSDFNIIAWLLIFFPQLIIDQPSEYTETCDETKAACVLNARSCGTVVSARGRLSEGLDRTQLVSSMDKISRNPAPCSSGQLQSRMLEEKEGSSDALVDTSLQYRNPFGHIAVANE